MTPFHSVTRQIAGAVSSIQPVLSATRLISPRAWATGLLCLASSLGACPSLVLGQSDAGSNANEQLVSATESSGSLDRIAHIQAEAAAHNRSDVLHWGPNGETYSSWGTHTNRLVPIYTFGVGLDEVAGTESIYRSKPALTKLYGQLPSDTWNEGAQYFDQTDVYRLQKWAVEAGKKHIVLFIFDGMDWETTRAAAIAKTGAVAYSEGRGTGLAFLDYRKAKTDFGFFVSSPHNNGTKVDVNAQRVTNPGGTQPGGFSHRLLGGTPWAKDPDVDYLIGKDANVKHAYTDSASSATSMNAGIKTYNNAINVDFVGREVVPIARRLQEQGFAVGSVTSVPFSHASAACTYANNVHRSDYQDISRDMVGLPSKYHPGGLKGLDVVLGAGWGEVKEADSAQGENFVPGNKYITDLDLQTISIDHANLPAADGVAGANRYVVAQREAGQSGKALLEAATKRAVAGQHRLFGMFGVKGGHLPFQTANGDYAPVDSRKEEAPIPAEKYSAEDVSENPVLADLTMSAVRVLDSQSDRWWLMIEAGDVDWANHANNIDDSIGAVLSGELAFQKLVRWVEETSSWDDTCIILTADHGHYLVLDRPELLTR